MGITCDVPPISVVHFFKISVKNTSTFRWGGISRDSEVSMVLSSKNLPNLKRYVSQSLSFSAHSFSLCSIFILGLVTSFSHQNSFLNTSPLWITPHLIRNHFTLTLASPYLQIGVFPFRLVAGIFSLSVTLKWTSSTFSSGRADHASRTTPLHSRLTFLQCGRLCNLANLLSHPENKWTPIWWHFSGQYFFAVFFCANNVDLPSV